MNPSFPHPVNSSPSCCHNGTMLLLFWLTPDVSYASLCTTCRLCVSVCICQRGLCHCCRPPLTLCRYFTVTDCFSFLLRQPAVPLTPRAWGRGMAGWAGGVGGVRERGREGLENHHNRSCEEFLFAFLSSSSISVALPRLGNFCCTS